LHGVRQVKKIDSVYVAGLGAIGASYAASLFEMDPECIKVIADKERIERYKKDGITVNGKTYDFKYIEAGEKAAYADLLIVSVKHHHLRQVISDVKNCVGPDTVILSLLNGISSEEIIGEKLGMEKLLYSFCVNTDAVRIGTDIRFSKLGTIVFGEKVNASHTARVDAVVRLFERAGIPYSVPQDMMRELWWKFMLNVGANQISAILKAPYGVFQRVYEARELMRMACREVLELSKKVGVNLDESDIEEFLRIIDGLAPEGKTSMMQDIEAGRKTEVEIFAGTVLALGQKYGIKTPVNDMLYKMILTLEQR
jgi:2-dehydropantoate 2-reductase